MALVTVPAPEGADVRLPQGGWGGGLLEPVLGPWWRAKVPLNGHFGNFPEAQKGVFGV